MSRENSRVNPSVNLDRFDGDYHRGTCQINAEIVRRVVSWTAIALACAFIVINLASPIATVGTGRPDFVAFYGAWRLTIEGRGGDLYNVTTQQATQPVKGSDFLPYINPPHVTTPLAPIGAVSYQQAVTAWLVMLYVALCCLVSKFWKLARGWTMLERCLFLTTFLASPFVLFSLVNGAFSILVALALLYWHTSQTETEKGAWLALASIKPHFAFLPFVALATQKRWRSVAVFLTINGLLVLIALPVYGWHAWPAYVSLLRRSESVGSGYTITLDKMPNLKSLIVLGGASHSTAVIVAAAALIVGAAVLIIVWKRNKSEAVKVSLALTLSVFLAPHANPHDCVILAVPAFLIYQALRSTRAGVVFAVFTVGAVLLYAVTLHMGLLVVAWRMPLAIACGLIGWSCYTFSTSHDTRASAISRVVPLASTKKPTSSGV